jgi:chaperonin GroEL (HSP60 family)
MLLDPMGGIVITNDGHCILREVDVSHPHSQIYDGIVTSAR